MYIIEVQGFQYKQSEFTIKELALLNVYDGQCQHFLVEQSHPKDWFSSAVRRHIEYTTNNIHGLDWDSIHIMEIPIENLVDCIKTIVGNKVILVKGLNQLKILNRLVPNKIINLENLFCPKFACLRNEHPGFDSESNNYHCNMHQINDLKCAKQHVYLLYEWFKKNKTF